MFLKIARIFSSKEAQQAWRIFTNKSYILRQVEFQIQRIPEATINGIFYKFNRPEYEERRKEVNNFNSNKTPKYHLISEMDMVNKNRYDKWLTRQCLYVTMVQTPFQSTNSPVAA